MSRLIGEAFISLLADTSMFPADAKAKVDAALRPVKGKVPVDADIGPAEKKIATLAAMLKGLGGKANIRVDTHGLVHDIASAETAVLGLMDRMDSLKLDADNTKLMQKFFSARGVVEDLAYKLDHMEANANMSKFISEIYGAKSVVEGLEKQMADMTAKVDVKYDRSFVGKLPSFQSPTVYNKGEAQFMNQLANATLTAMTRFRSFNDEVRQTSVLTPIVAAGLERMARGQSMIVQKGSGFWGVWNNQIRLFGGALDRVMPKWMRAISMWHLAADVAFEFAAAWVPALIAVGAFAAYAIPTGQKIYSQWKNINTILDGVGSKTLPDLGKTFDVVQKAIQPSIVMLWGEYMLTVGKNATGIGTALAGVGRVADAWGAKMVVWADRAGKGLANIIRSGSHDFALIGYGFQQVFRIISEIIKAMPGIVHVLLPVGDAFLTIVANTIKALGPVLKFGLLLHGVAVYAGLAVTAVVALGRAMAVAFSAKFAGATGIRLMSEEAVAGTGKFSRFGAAIGAFAGQLAGGSFAVGRYTASLFKLGEDAAKTGVKARLASAGSKLLGDALKFIPFGAVGIGAAAAAVAIGVVLYFALRHSATAAQQFNAQMQKLIASSTSANLLQNLTIAFKDTTAKINDQRASIAQLTKGYVGNSIASAGVVSRLSGQSQAWSDNRTQLAQYQAGLQQVLGQTNNYANRLGQLVTLFGSTSAAQTAMNLAGIKAVDLAKASSSQWADDFIKLKALASGYGYMGSQIGAAGAQLNTLNITSGTTFKNVQALQQAESQWVTTLTAGENAFTTFEQGQNTLNGTLKGTAGNATTLRVRLGNLTQTYSAVGAKMQGTSASSLAARQAFDQQLTAATTLWGNLQMLSTASGNTAKSTGQLAMAGKDIIAQLLPFAAGSKQATAEVSGLAQIMGGPATTNFQVLAKWVGHTKGAEGDLNKQQAALTISASNLSVAAKNLGNALETGLAQSEAAAIAKTFGLDRAINGLAANVQKSGHQVNATAVTMAGQYVAALHKSGESTKQATQDLNAYLARLGYTPSQIKQIDGQLGVSAGQWNKYEQTVNHNASAQKNFQNVTKGNGAAFKNLSTNLSLGSVASNALWHAIVKQDSAMVANGGHARNAQRIFAELARNGLGVTTAQANALWAKFGHQNLDWLAAHAANTHKSFVNFAMHGLHLSNDQAQALWKVFTQQQLDMLMAKANKGKSTFIDLAVNGLHMTRNEANKLWDTMRRQYLDTLAQKAGETKAAFEKTAAQFGLTKAQADNLWSSLHKLAAGSPYGVSVNETLSGKGRLTAAVSGTAVTIASTPAGAASNANIISASNAVGKAAAGLPRHHAAGYLVPPGSSPAGRDGYHAVLAPGELVIPTSHVASHLALAKQQGIPGAKNVPGMASGGWAPSTVNSIAENAQVGVSTLSKGALQATANAIAKWVQNINTSFAAQQAAMSGGGGPGTATPGLIAIAKYLISQGVSKAAAAGIAGTIAGESGGNPESRNCVPLTYKVVTHRGILAHDEVRPGDYVPAWDVERGCRTVAIVLDVPYHLDDAQMCRFGSDEWSVTCTVDHKWITESRGLVRADKLLIGEKIIIGDGRLVAVYNFERLPDADTFCLTTTAGTWTTVTDEGDVILTGNSGGWGLIGWTGNRIGLPGGYSGPTGNVARDMQIQSAGIIGYGKAVGPWGRLIRMTNPLAAGQLWSSAFEKPAVRYSDVRPGVIASLYAKGLAQGGLMPGHVRRHSAGGMVNEPVYGVGANSGLPYSFAENGRPEYVGPLSGSTGSSHMPPMTTRQGDENNRQLDRIARLLQQLPTVLGKAVAQGSGNGARHGYYGAQA